MERKIDIKHKHTIVTSYKNDDVGNVLGLLKEIVVKNSVLYNDVVVFELADHKDRVILFDLQKEDLLKLTCVLTSMVYGKKE